MDLGAVELGFCDCFFNTTEVKQNGGWETDGNNKMAAPDDEARKRCIQNCKEQYLKTVSADYGETFSGVCDKLTTKGPNPNLWPLYWCDSTYCGVGIDPQGPEGQDRE